MFRILGKLRNAVNFLAYGRGQANISRRESDIRFIRGTLTDIVMNIAPNDGLMAGLAKTQRDEVRAFLDSRVSGIPYTGSPVGMVEAAVDLRDGFIIRMKLRDARVAE